jgi:glycosyltransferase involved in cell wall biosynthesis
MSNPLVSIVTPCYNGESYLDRYFSAILAQTYPSIELIFVDDGSTDGTLALAESWRGRLESHGFVFKLLTHENGGQASAINLALPAVNGKYITWPDSDDLMSPDNIARKVSFLEGHPECGLVACSVNMVDEDDLDKVVAIQRFDKSVDPRLFEALLSEQQGAFCSGIAYMARMQCLIDALGGRRIYESRSGQNWQLLFPLTYHYDCGFIDEPLATYVVRNSSHSHSYTSIGEQLRRTYELQDIIDHVLPTMNMDTKDLKASLHYASVKYLRKRFRLAVGLGDYSLAKEVSERLDGEFGVSRLRHLILVFTNHGLGPALYKTARFAKHALHKAQSTLSWERR